MKNRVVRWGIERRGGGQRYYVRIQRGVWDREER